MRDVFLCHANSDKKTYVQPLIDAFSKHAISCWVDEAQINPGDSIIEAISEGLVSSRYVVVLITPEFLERRWTQKELNSALSREIRTGIPTVIPILAIPQNEFSKRYPLLADKLYLAWERGTDHIASAISERFARIPHNDWYFTYPTEYVGLIWIRITLKEENVSINHDLELRWGPYIKRFKFDPDGNYSVSLVLHKTNRDNIILHLNIEPAGIATFGEGSAPDREAVNIDEGWTRSAGGQWPGHL